MPAENRFRHQVYTDASPVAVYRLIRPESYPDVGSEEFLSRMQSVGDMFRDAGVGVIYLVHGTFVGHDAGGLWTELSRLLPGAGDVFAQLNKKLIDSVVGEQGNYTERFAKLFENSINRDHQRRIPVRLFRWSSENHHVGRTDAAVKLLQELDELKEAERVMLWGHSHGGNIFALMTNLLGGDQESVDEFFEAARLCYYSPVRRRKDQPHWQKMWQRLKSEPGLFSERKCDFVTFGTPIRYGWDSSGYRGLLHFVNHRPAEGLPDYLTRFPPSLDDVMKATDGDYIQQLGIAGTNVVPGIFSWRNFMADRKLNELLQPNILARHLKQRLKIGMRVPEDGASLLVDYGPQTGTIAKHLAGHAVYTQSDWLLFHAEQTAEFLRGRFSDF